MNYYQKVVNIIGCGFAGIECALFLARHDIKVHIFDIHKEYKCNCDRCKKIKECEKEELFEGLLRRELNYLGSPLIREEDRLIRAGYSGCLATKILEYGKKLVKINKNIEYFEACISQLNPREINVISTGSNTDEKMFNFLLNKFGSMRCFNKLSVCPIVDNIEISALKRKEGDNEYFYLPLDYNEYLKFVNSIIKVINSLGKENTKNLCANTIEELAVKGRDALRSFCLMPIYLKDLKEKPYAVLTLKKMERGYRLEGISSKLSRQNQLEIIKSLKGFSDVELLQEGNVEDAVYINSKYVINEFNQSVQDKNLFFAGAILGLSNFHDCIASGYMTALNVYKYYNDMKMVPLPNSSLMGRLAQKIISTSLLKKNSNLENYDIIANQDDYANPSLLESLFNNSVGGLLKFKEDYRYGEHV